MTRMTRMTRTSRSTRTAPRFTRLVLGLALVAALAAPLALTGCSSKPAADSAKRASSATNGEPTKAAFPVKVTDDSGRDVTIEAEPKRIVSLAPANTEIVAALGLTDRLVAVTTYCDYPPEVTKLPKIGDFASPNIEAIAAAKPDLILATTGVQAETVAKLEKLGAAVVALDPQTLTALYRSIKVAGEATGATGPAESLVESMQLDVAEISDAVSAEPPVRSFFEIGQNPLYTVGSGTLLDDLIRMAGGQNVVTQSGYVAYSLEQLVKDDPDAYLAGKGTMSDPESLEQRPGFDKLKAVQSGAIYIFDDNLVMRPGPRLVEGLRDIAAALHPNVVKK